MFYALCPMSGFVQEDSDPIHKVQDVTDWFDYKTMSIYMLWPWQSLDLNPVEHFRLGCCIKCPSNKEISFIRIVSL